MPKNAEFSELQFEKMCNIVKENPKILSPPDLLKINRSVSYMTFILKEIYESVSLKTPEGESVFHIRKLYKKVNEINKIRDHLNKTINI